MSKMKSSLNHIGRDMHKISLADTKKKIQKQKGNKDTPQHRKLNDKKDVPVQSEDINATTTH